MTHNTILNKRISKRPVLRRSLGIFNGQRIAKTKGHGGRWRIRLSFIVYLSLAGVTVQAGSIQSLATQNTAMSIIGGNALSEVRGAISVNLTAGDGNVQGNNAAIAFASNGIANVQTLAVQQTDKSFGKRAFDATAEISDHAFAKSIGLISINQTSGTGNSQLNEIGITIGTIGSSLSENALAETSAKPFSPGESVTTTAGRRNVSISETAFAQAAGVVQVNQAAGSGNISANSFALNLPTSAKF